MPSDRSGGPRLRSVRGPAGVAWGKAPALLCVQTEAVYKEWGGIMSDGVYRFWECSGCGWRMSSEAYESIKGHPGGGD